MECENAPSHSLEASVMQISAENNLVNLINGLENMQAFTRTIKSEDNHFAIKEEAIERVKEEYMFSYSELAELGNILVKEELAALYEELETSIGTGISVPYEEFENFATSTYVKGELLIPYDHEDNFMAEQSVLDLENSSSSNSQDNYKVMRECSVKLAKLPVNFEIYSLKELEMSVVQVLNSNKTNYKRNGKKPLQTNFKANKTGKCYNRCYYPDKRPLCCNMCDYKTPYKYLLTRHKKIHKGKHPYACSMCDFRTARKEDYLGHQRVHKGSKPFICNQCDFRASRKTYLSRHKYVHYPKENLFTCATCDYRTPFKENLKRHMLIHSNQKPFVCKVCDFRTVHKVIIKSHSRIHSGEKPFTCKFCSYTTAHYSSLGKHTKTHNGTRSFPCNICNYKAMFKEHLRRHLRTHTGEKPFTCGTCDFSTAHKESLKVHKNIHTKEKFVCDKCEFTTSHCSSMNRHLTKVHKAKKSCCRKQ